ncbi:HIT family protein [Luteolibacter sp. AS25]|uniref:HIT family protein n=1 Tax=Luteolibacter sp. AS25 TaxID=3135776 RepID=UPI00398B857A
MGCRIMMKNETQFPWFIVVPEVEEGVEDLHQLGPEKFSEVMEVVREVSLFVSAYFSPEKLNVACIGNAVRQMHIHVVARSPEDPAWPGVVWAHSEKSKFMNSAEKELVSAAREALSA